MIITGGSRLQRGVCDTLSLTWATNCGPHALTVTPSTLYMYVLVEALCPVS